MIVEKVRASKDPNFGYNAATETFEDLVAAGIIDPAKSHALRVAKRRINRGLDAHDGSPHF